MFISILLIDSRGSIFACFWCFLLGALQFVIRIVGRGYLHWNYSIVHRRSPAPRRVLPREPLALPVPTSDLRAEARRLQPAAAVQLSGRAELIRIKLPICLRMRMRYPRGERAATAQQLTGRTGSDRAAYLQRHCTANTQRLQRAAIALQIAL